MQRGPTEGCHRSGKELPVLDNFHTFDLFNHYNPQVSSLRSDIIGGSPRDLKILLTLHLAENSSTHAALFSSFYFNHYRFSLVFEQRLFIYHGLKFD